MGGVNGVQEGETSRLFDAPALDFQPFSPIRFPLMTLVSIPANPVPEDVVIRHHQDARRRRVALRALGAAGGPQGHGLRLHRAQRADRKIFRDGARLARPRLRGGDDRLARAGAFVAAPARSAQGLCPRLLRFRSRRRDLRAAGGAAGLPAAVFRAGPFDGRRGACCGSRMPANAGSTAWCCRRR